MGDVARHVELAAVALLVAVAVREARRARAVARTAAARASRDVAIRADRPARPAVVGLRSGVDLAAVDLLLAVAVRVAALAGSIANACGARRCRDVLAPAGAREAAASAVLG